MPLGSYHDSQVLHRSAKACQHGFLNVPRLTYDISHLCLEEGVGDVLFILHVRAGELISIVMADNVPGKDGEADVRLIDELRHC